MSEVYIAISLSDGSVAHMAFQTKMRAPGNPGGPWVGPDKDGFYSRDASDVNIEYEVARASRHWQQDGKATISWRRLNQEQHEMFGKERDYRNALEDVGGAIKHNMKKACELHRAVLRHLNGEKLLTLDREWVDATAIGDTKAAEDIDAIRKKLRKFVNDPRIDAAQDVEELKALVPSEVR